MLYALFTLRGCASVAAYVRQVVDRVAGHQLIGSDSAGRSRGAASDRRQRSLAMRVPVSAPAYRRASWRSRR